MFSVEGLLEYGPLGLFLVAFFESTVFPIPPDVLLLPLCLMNPRLSWWYAFLTTAASILGAFLGYAIGRRAGRPVVEKSFTREMVEKVEVLFRKYGGWAVGIAAFTPVPYKVFTFGAGVFRVPFLTFTAASIIGRAGRFFLEGAMVYFLGDRARTYLGRNFEIATLAVTAVLLVAVAAFPKIDAFLRRRRVFDHPAFRGLARTLSEARAHFRSVRSLGVRFLAGLTASAVFLQLVVVYLWDLSGAERVVLNRTLSPVYRRFSDLMGVQSGAGFWSIWGSPWMWAPLAVAGVLRWVSWESRSRPRGRARESGRPEATPRTVSGGSLKSLVRIASLSVGTFICEAVFGNYINRIYGPGFLSLPPGYAFLSPYFLVFGAYLASKGTPKLFQVPLLGIVSALAAGNSAHMVSSVMMDAAAATASLLVSLLMLAVSYTLLLSVNDKKAA